METILKITNLHKKYGKVHAVNNVSIEIKKGNVYGILGPNGSGKSTTLGIVLNVVNKTSGDFQWFDGAHSTHEALKKVGAIIERPDLYPYLTAKEHLELFAKLSKQKITKDQIAKTLEQVGLSLRSADKVNTFSLGMKQRLGIAIALVHNPDLIILDEPTNGLDPQGIADIRHLIQNLSKQEGKTVLVSSHLLSEIEQVASQILIIHQGKKVAMGPTQTLLDPNKAIIHIVTQHDEQALSILGISKYAQNIMQRNDGIYLSIATREIPALHQFIVAANIPLMSFELKRSLEDYFLQITSMQ